MNHEQTGTTAGRPVVYLLTGLPGAGKSTHARALERTGVVRLSVDEEVLDRHGRFGVDYPAQEHLARMRPVYAEILDRLVAHVTAGRSVVLDHGLGRRAERDACKQLALRHGATWRLLHLTADRAELLRRLAGRAGTHPVALTPDMFAWLEAHEQPPVDEGEEVIFT